MVICDILITFEKRVNKFRESRRVWFIYSRFPTGFWIITARKLEHKVSLRMTLDSLLESIGQKKNLRQFNLVIHKSTYSHNWTVLVIL